MTDTIKKALKDKLSREILTFFYQNQSSIDTVSGVAAWVRADRDKVKQALDKLVQLGVLEEDSIGSTKGYCYTRKENVMKAMKKLMSENE
ncbi:MAG: hypothetical protein PVH45_04715 [Candidatus Omnitrophota bacterium]|jgi:hypothetical protein